MPATENSRIDTGSVMGPARRLRIVTPHDVNELEYVANGIVAATAGTISIIAQDDTVAVPLTVNAGQIYPVRARIVRATGTTATGIVALIS